MAAGKEESNGSAEASKIKNVKQDESEQKQLGKKFKSDFVQVIFM